jgi:hypothetical protein
MVADAVAGARVARAGEPHEVRSHVPIDGNR